MKRYALLLCFLMIAGTQTFANDSKTQPGVARMLDVDIQFMDAFGKTITNEQGIFYHIWWDGREYVFYEQKIYPSEYWGEYPLYFFGSQVGVRVTVRNNGPANRAKLLIKTEAQVLRTDGSAGVALAPTKTSEVLLARGETKTLDASFVAEYNPQAESGLDTFTVKVLHQNEGGGPGNQDPALIMVKRGVFCPPKYKPR